MSNIKFPTEVIKLPSQGLIYPETSPLSSGEVELKYMTAKEEDILSNQSYIEKGTVLDKLLESVIIGDVNIKDLIVGDKNAILVATRMLGYGKDYKFLHKGEEHTVDLSTLENVEIDTEKFIKGENSFNFTLPNTDTEITFKLLNGNDESKIDRELKGLKKLNPNNSPVISTRLKYLITSVGGDTDTKTIREYVDTQLLAVDSRALRNYIRGMQPDINLIYELESGEEVDIPLGISFFWPDI